MKCPTYLKYLCSKQARWIVSGVVLGIIVATIVFVLFFKRVVSYDLNTGIFVETIYVGPFELIRINLPYTAITGVQSESKDYVGEIVVDKRSLISPNVSPSLEGEAILLLSQDLTAYSNRNRSDTVADIVNYWSGESETHGHSHAADKARELLLTTIDREGARRVPHDNSADEE